MTPLSLLRPCRTATGSLLGALAVLAMVGCAAAQPSAATAARSPDPADPAAAVRVDHVGITVADLDASVAFFTGVLDFQTVSETQLSGAEFDRAAGLTGAAARRARLRLGDEFIELTQYESPSGRPFPRDSRSNDLWFQHIAIIVSDMDRAFARLQAHNVPAASRGPQRLPDWNPSAGGIRAYYFRDPDGHFLEILQFPAGKGDPKWQARPADSKRAALFLGIDHTAIVVRDTQTSLKFYRDALGMRIVGGSENYGPEQEALNNVPGARLRITTLRGDGGPGIELLEYLQPRDGRGYPADARACDLLHWQTGLLARDMAELARRLAAADAPLVSAGAAADSAAEDSRSRGRPLVFRDPDGHALFAAGE